METKNTNLNLDQEIEVIGIRFKHLGKIYYFKKPMEEVVKDTPIIVQTSKGVEYGNVKITSKILKISTDTPPIRDILRLATDEDKEKQKLNREKELEFLQVCISRIKEHNLDMNLIDVELIFDLSKIIFYFTSNGRVDFRSLVTDLASIFRMRIELRQVGVRDEAKIKNGIGICGRTLCCATFLDEFKTVSIKMAKEQNVALNPTKISGACGRLMCCLKYEEENYSYLSKNLPSVNDIVKTPDGEGVVLAVNIIQQLLKVSLTKLENEDSFIGFYNASETTIIKKNNVQ